MYPRRILCALVLACAGCGQQVEVERVAGRVLVEGTPFAAAFVTFVADGEETAALSTQTGADGTFAVTCFGRVVKSGAYRVVVRDPRKSPSLGQMRAAQSATRGLAVYGHPERTPIAVDLAAGNNELPPFELRGGE